MRLTVCCLGAEGDNLDIYRRRHILIRDREAAGRWWGHEGGRLSDNYNERNISRVIIITIIIIIVIIIITMDISLSVMG